MSSNILENLRHRRRLAANGVWLHNGQQSVQHASNNSFLNIIIAGFVAWIFVYFVAWFVLGVLFNIPSKISEPVSSFLGVAMTFWIWFKPLWLVLWSALRHWQKPQWHLLNHFSQGEKLAACFFASVFILVIFKNYYPEVVFFLRHNILPWLGNHLSPSIQFFGDKYLPTPHVTHAHLRPHEFVHGELKMPIHVFLLWWLIIAVALYGLLGILALSSKGSPKQKAVSKSKALNFSLWIGESTGLLAERGHKTSVAIEQQIALGLPQACQNILILGGIGSGKTACAITPLLLQLMDQHCGGLIFDMKGDFQHTVEGAAQLAHRPYVIVGTEHIETNLIADLTPEVVSSMLKSAFLLGNPGAERFWINTAGELSRCALGMLKYFPEHYSLKGLYDYLFVADFHAMMDNKAVELMETLELSEMRLLQTYLSYQLSIFSKFDEKVKSGVLATCAEVLSPFNHPELIDAFCNTRGEHLSLRSILDGDIFLVQLPIARWGLGAKVIYTLIKLGFFNLMQQRALDPTLNQETPVFFMCDEYQEIISANKDGLSDLNFWDKSRSSKTIGIISSQSISSFYAVIGDRELADAILQNFRQKICFRTEDEPTIRLFNYLVGDAEIVKTSKAHASHREGLLNHQKSKTTTYTQSTEKQAVVDGQFFRTMRQGEALAVLTLNNGLSADDLLRMFHVDFA